MTRKQLIEQIQLKRSYLCVGLDTDLAKIPKHLQSHPDAAFEFNKQIIDATKDLCVSYKINTAFYEAMGLKGWEAMQKTVNYIPNEHLVIADAKRGDIGNTSTQYANAFFEAMNFDAITVAPYMGEDSVKPFLEFENKWAIVLGLLCAKPADRFRDWLSRPLVHPWAQHLGRVSYSVYLAHLPLLAVVQFCLLNLVPGVDRVTHFCLLFVGTLLVTLPVSTLLYAKLELPFMRLGRSLTATWAGRSRVPVRVEAVP